MRPRAHCTGGQCSPQPESGPSEPDPASDEDIPFGVETVTDSSLTVAEFAASLPKSFRGNEQIADPGSQMASATFHPRLVETSATYYHRPDSSEPDRITAVAMAGSLPASLSAEAVIDDVRTENASAPSFSVIGQSTAAARFPFVQFKATANDVVGDAYYLVWGWQEGDCVYLLSALSPDELTAFAHVFVARAR